MPLLKKINNPNDLKQLNYNQLETLSNEIRDFLIENVSVTGGHLSSNLGTVELCVALHKVFNTPIDKIVFDVGHQCYTHKILTGRKNGFSKLRMENGISGFPSPKESEHDAFIAGHGNVAISVAIGLARAKKIKGEAGKVIALVGDGAFTGGMVYEGINNIDTLDNLIVILNDNKMSISKNVGSISKYFTRLRTSTGYFRVKRNMETALDTIPVIGKSIKLGMSASKSVVRRAIYKSTWFEEMGFQYLGPVDGHNIKELVTTFASCEAQERPLFINCLTVKGKGFTPAENNPGAFHGVSTFNVESVQDPDATLDESFSVEFGKHLVEIAKGNKKICAITAAMKYGTGLQFFYKRFKNRFFDVGMAEQHAVTFAAGLAKEGLKPVVCLYSTFLQRSYDQLIHDVCLQNLDVLFAIDRAGLVPGDGCTHQGIYDVAFLSQQPNLTIVSPSNFAELKFWLDELTSEKHVGTKAIRYPRGKESEVLKQLPLTKNTFDIYGEDKKTAIISYGAEIEQVLVAQKDLASKGINVDVIKLTVVNPLPNNFINSLLQYEKLVFIEEGIEQGSVAQHTATALLKSGYKGVFDMRALPTQGIDHATIDQLKKQNGIDAKSIVNLIECGE